MHTLRIPAGTLILLSGPSGSGKSTFVDRAQLPVGFVVAPDALRAQFAGQQSYVQQGQWAYRLSEDCNDKVWATVANVVDYRLQERLTTVVDATLLTEDDRKTLVQRAVAAHVPYRLLISTATEAECQAGNAARARRLAPAVVTAQCTRFVRQSRFVHELVDFRTTQLVVTPMLALAHPRVDIVGDVHGLLAPLQRLLTRLGYLTVDGAIAPDRGRILLFLGDLVDRGPDSLDVLRLVKQLVDAKLAYALLGNHEAKLLRFWAAVQEQRLGDWSSRANAETGLALLRARPEEAAALVAFLQGLPTSAVYADANQHVAMVHADVDTYDALTSSRAELIYGFSRFGSADSDAYAQEYLDAQRRQTGKRHTLVRGHIDPTSAQPDVLVLERKQAYGGHLAAWPLDAWLAAPERDKEELVVLEPTGFDYASHAARRYRLADQLRSLRDRKLVTCTVDGATGLKLYKYHAKVHYDGLWGADPALRRARGLVLDAAGNIAVHPFTKVFNAGAETLQYGGRVPTADELVVAVQKLNGFLGVVSPHPVARNELLVTTTGSFDSPFVGYVRQYIDRTLRGAFLRYFAKEGPVSFLFEVLHPDDPHIVVYSESMFGLHLIGARGLAEDDLEWPEAALDAAAVTLGVRRATWERIPYGALTARLAGEKVEGYMVRADDSVQTMLTKLKGPYYVTTKFLARMGAQQWKHLFAHPRNFKQKVDEEFYGLVDWLHANQTFDQVTAMDEEAKKAMLRRYLGT